MNDLKLKYPRTYHFEWSEGCVSDDKIQHDLSSLYNKDIIITLKMDGENTTMMNDCYYARSIDSNNHPSRNYVKGLWGNIKHEIPYGFRICGENLYAKHSIEYNDLVDYFQVFSIWDENNLCLSWEETIDYCNLLGLNHVQVIDRFRFDIDKIKNLKIDTNIHEGYVVRNADSFNYADFDKNVIKWVRKNHIQSDTHWSKSKIIKNNLKY
jgi:hypothetical protein